MSSASFAPPGYLPLKKAVEKAFGFRVAPATLHRWRNRDKNPLQCVRIGGKYFATVEMVKEFAEEVRRPAKLTGELVKELETL